MKPGTPAARSTRKGSENALRISISVPDGKGDVTLDISIERRHVSQYHREVMERVLTMAASLAAPKVVRRAAIETDYVRAKPVEALLDGSDPLEDHSPGDLDVRACSQCGSYRHASPDHDEATARRGGA